MKVSAIYKIQSVIKPKHTYIGSAINVNRRWSEHLRRLRLNTHPNNKLQHHYNKYGKDDLIFSILLGCNSEELIKTEQYFIDSYKPWFNICPVAGSSKGRKTPEEVKEKIRQSRKRQVNTNKGQRWQLSEPRKKPVWNKGTKGVMIPWNKGKKYHHSKKRDNSNYHGYEMTIEQKMAISERFKGKKISEERREAARERALGNSYALGCVRSEETRKRISEGMKRLNLAGSRGNKVINILTGEMYSSIWFAAKSMNMKYRTLHAQLAGENQNKTNLRLVA